MRRTILLLLALLAAPATVLVVVACDDGGTLAVPVDASTAEAAKADAAAAPDEGVADASSDAPVVEAASMADVCGPAPWVNLGIIVVALDLSDPDGSVLPGATFTSPLCPGLEKVSDDAGVINGLISQNTPFYGRLTAPNYISELAPVEVFDADSTGNRIEMLPQILSGLLPDYAADASGLTLIPLNMAEPILITRGLDAANGLGFSPHGAGRNFSRSSYMKANAGRTEADMIAEQAPGIDVRYFCGVPDISELPMAYKNAASMRRQIDKFGLAEVVETVEPIGNIMAGDWQRDAPWRKKKRPSEPNAQEAA